ncbi:MAG: hypothetical protein QOE54_858 [Streptosporangiaceae bacterium]|jgi:hypothetical protein|nr:hypothetical protein [Streptosporangiaceae bacterium]MDX6428492.1 hypothetical protein [Streptosporangiaceae bacterium]
MSDTKMISPALLQRHLHNVNYPASRNELIAHTRGECERVISTLQQLPDRQYSRPTDVSKAFAEVAGSHLAGMSYPARRDDLAQYARSQGAGQPVITALERIPDRDYDDLQVVIVAVAEEED